MLFDEVDKAHPDVLTVMLQLFDEVRGGDDTRTDIQRWSFLSLYMYLMITFEFLFLFRVVSQMARGRPSSAKTPSSL